jgi:predicted acyltransferase
MNEVNQLKNRLASLDFFRGLVMFLLIAEFAHLFEVLMESGSEQLTAVIDFLFHHAQWEGLHFWDLVQPFFMFIVGVSIPLSYANRKRKGDTEQQIRNHAFQRSFLLLLFGWGLYCIGPQKIVFQFDNVLAQLSFTYLISFLLLKQSSTVQIASGFVCILISDLLYRFFPVAGFDQAFVAGENFGAWFNILITGYEYGGHWAAFNFLPTAAHTLWGVVAGNWLMENSNHADKLKRLLIAGIVTLILGYLTTFFTPVIKRISTTSFVLLSGGWTFLALSLCYWLIDVKGILKKTFVFKVVGVNPLFIYLFASLGGGGLFLKIIRPFSTSIIGGVSPWLAELISGLGVLFGLWYLCYWLYKKQIFIRI